ncbi:hypothetical protein AB0L74_02915 [Streptomyces sp. NPDC052020]
MPYLTNTGTGTPTAAARVGLGVPALAHPLPGYWDDIVSRSGTGVSE